MKIKMIIAIVTMMLLAHSALSAEESDNEWLRKHAAIKTTETTEKDANGNVKSIRVVKDTAVYIRQTVTETLKPNAKGENQVISRTTVSSDVKGGSATIVESLLAGSTTLVTTAITTVERVDDKVITTNYARDKFGKMVVTGKVTSIANDNGVGAISISF